MPTKSSNVNQQQLDRAKRWPIGTPVTVRRDNGELLETVTQSAPWKLSAPARRHPPSGPQNGDWVILVGGIVGAYALERVAERAE